MSKYTFLTLLVVLSVLAFLVSQASRGSVLAIVIASSLATVTLIVTGASILIVYSNLTAKREQQRFESNIKENLAIMGRMQSIQNAQNSQLLKQVKELPDTKPAETLFIDDAVFSELEAD